MKRKAKRFTDEQALQIATEFVTTSISIKELQRKYDFNGVSSVYKWISKFGLSKPDDQTIKMNQIMEKEQNKSPREQALEKEIEELKRQLDYEKLRSRAYQKMIEIAERDLSITIKKKSGRKQ